MYHNLKKYFNSGRSHQSCSIEKAVLKHFAIFTGKHPCEYCKIFINTYFDDNLRTTASAVPASYC